MSGQLKQGSGSVKLIITLMSGRLAKVVLLYEWNQGKKDGFYFDIVIIGMYKYRFYTTIAEPVLVLRVYSS